jgi:hypothetical protein
MIRMSKDVFWEVRNRIAQNSSISQDLLAYLSADRNEDVRAYRPRILGLLRRPSQLSPRTGAGR